MQQQGLFGNYRYCEFCRRPLSLDYEGTLCPGCVENELFSRVKEYIRSNDVTEYEVAEHFEIPLYRVKKWIREGRIEYKDNKLNTITMHCTICGASISFGTLCAKCLRQKGTSGHSAPRESEPSRMRYLEDAKYN